jgi:hypothetical protein
VSRALEPESHDLAQLARASFSAVSKARSAWVGFAVRAGRANASMTAHNTNKIAMRARGASRMGRQSYTPGGCGRAVYGCRLLRGRCNGASTTAADLV